MNVTFGTQIFNNVYVPMLWGKRAVIGHTSGELSVIDLSDSAACPEVVSDKPWSNIEFSEKEDGYIIFKGGDQSFFYSPPRKLLRDLEGNLPECEISDRHIRIGTNTVQNSIISGSQVGIGVSEDGFFMGGPMPEGLAKLIF